MPGEEIKISRVTRSKTQAKANYDKISSIYDLIAGRFEKKHRNSGLRLLDVQEGEKVLEIGFGTGHGIKFLAEKVGDSGIVYGIDISDGMLSVTSARIKKAGLEKRTEIRCGDAVNLDYESELVDSIFMSFTLELFDTPEIPTVLTECYRVLKARGQICILAMSKRVYPNPITRLYEWLHTKFPVVIDCRPIYCKQAIEKAGFMISKTLTSSIYSIPIDIILAQKSDARSSLRQVR